MLDGQQPWKCWLVCMGVFSLCSSAFGQFQPSQARVHHYQAPQPVSQFYFGVLGQVARPGVYELSNSQPDLRDLIQQAGGLTTKATNQIRIVRQGNAGQIVFYSPALKFPLAPGDLIVADGPLMGQAQNQNRLRQTSALPTNIQTAEYSVPENWEFSEAYRQVALVNLIERPVILPVPSTHANLQSVLAYLGQQPGLAGSVKVLPVGRGRTVRQTSSENRSEFSVPTVLYFHPQTVDRARLPKLPDVYHDTPKPLEVPSELQTAELAPLPTLTVPPAPLTFPSDDKTPERFQRPGAHSVVALPDTPSQVDPNTATEPPLIAKFRDLENRIPSPTPSEPTLAAKPTRENPMSSDFAGLGSDAKTENTKPRKNSGWPYLGVVALLLVSAGLYAKLRRPRMKPDRSAAVSVPQLSAPPAEQPRRVDFPLEPQPVSPPVPNLEPELELPNDPLVSLTDAALEALVFNQLPVQEETSDSQPLEPVEKPAKSRKVFRVDPPEEQTSVVHKKPYIASRSKPVESLPAEQTPDATPQRETVNAPTEDSVQSVLDRVLQQVHQTRAA